MKYSSGMGVILLYDCHQQYSLDTLCVLETLEKIQGLIGHHRPIRPIRLISLISLISLPHRAQKNAPLTPCKWCIFFT